MGRIGPHKRKMALRPLNAAGVELNTATEIDAPIFYATSGLLEWDGGSRQHAQERQSSGEKSAND
jgi:hypothetical protein